MATRRKKNRKVSSPPIFTGFEPTGIPFELSDTITVQFEEYEALRLADYKCLTQKEAAEIMKISRPTFTRIYDSCLKKIAKAFTEGKKIVINGGNAEFDKQWYRCNECFSVFHELEDEKLVCSSCSTDNLEHINASLKDWNQG